jgi:hypothetical protein
MARPAVLKFLSTTVGVASKVKELSLVNEENEGGAVITLTRFTTTSNVESVAGGTCTTGQMLAPKEKCTLEFSMTPSTTGPNSGRVDVMSDAADGDLTISTSAIGTPAD